jgi:hypothetical protein
MGNKARWRLPLTESTVESAALPRAAALISFAAFVAIDPRGRAAYTWHCGRFSTGSIHGRPIRNGAEAPGCVRRCAVLFWFSAQVRAGRGRSRIVRRPGPPTGPAPAPPPHLAWPIAVATPPITPLLQPLPPTPGSLSSGAVGRRGRVVALRRHWGHEARHRCSRRSGSSSSRRRRRTLYGPAVLPTASTLWRPPLVLPSTLCTSAVEYPPVVWFHTVPSSAQRSPGRRTWRPTTCYLRRAISSRHL